MGTEEFAEKEMTCSNAWARLTKYLKVLGVYHGQSLHSTRRGSMQQTKLHKHETHKEVGEAAMCKESNAKILY